MIDFSGYTAKSIEKDMLSQVRETIDTREGSMVQTAVGPAAWYLEGVYMLLAKMQDNAYAETAVGASLDLIVRERGLTRKLATPTVRKGTFNVPIASGAQFKTINGSDSVIFVCGKLLSRTDEDYVYAMTCRTVGGYRQQLRGQSASGYSCAGADVGTFGGHHHGGGGG